MKIAAVVVTVVLPVMVWPGAALPFSSPKFLLLGVAVVTGMLWAAFQGCLWRTGIPRNLTIVLAIWLAVLGGSAALGEFASPEALLLSLFGVGWFLTVLSIRPPAQHMAVALTLSGALIGCVALLQFANLDLFVLFGWIHPPMGSPRMKVFATLGNPNFVAAFLITALPLSFALASRYRSQRVYFFMAALVQALAVAVTGSRAVLLALLAMLLWLGCVGTRRWQIAAAGITLAVLPVLVWTSGRTLPVALEGRVYIWRAAGPHLAEKPTLGFGPGAFAPKFVEWETQRWRDGLAKVDEQGFVGLQDHAHNDFLETAVDHGLAGLAAWLSLTGALLAFAWRRIRETGSELLLGVSAGAVALLAISLVDFPFRRPTETFAFWTLGAILFLADTPPKWFDPPGQPLSGNSTIEKEVTQ